MTRKSLVACTLALITYCQSAGAAEDLNAGKAVVENLHATLLQVMIEADTLGFSGRKEKLEPVLAECFDFTTIARIVTGKQWQEIDSLERENFVTLFARLSLATYASNFDGFSGESFETLAIEQRRGNLLVKTAIVKADGNRVTLNYLLRDNDGVWRIVNVIADGVSDLSLKRAEYTAVIKSEGFNSLLTKLNGKIENYESSGH